jgi:acyl-CoA thioester hydrolase
MPPASIRVQRRIEWSDTDASGYYHNTAVFRMIEAAEAALFERLGILEAAYGRVPRAHISADFLLPLRHRDLMDITLEVAEIRRTSITYRFRMDRDGQTAVKGTVAAVLVDPETRKPIPWPDELRQPLLTQGNQPPELLTR